jgi:hypothetical protein
MFCEVLAMGHLIPAKVRFLLPEEGGNLNPAHDGSRSQLKIGEVYTSCIVNSASEATIFDAGVDYDVLIDVILWNEYASRFNEKAPIQLYEGRRLAATGNFL